jgi:CDP-diacylglycerol--glycerol-3-phosphate 3-phosphatidyltransferase
LISAKTGHRLDRFLVKLYGIIFCKRKVTPNTLTLMGLCLALAAAGLLGGLQRAAAGFLLLLSGLFDVMDGAVARSDGRATRFGGFLDSVLDRYSDLSVMTGLTIYFSRTGDTLGAVSALVATVGAAIIPYARARAEAASIPCRVGLLERPERLIILLLGLFFDLLRPAAIILAVLTHVTVIQRIVAVRKASTGPEPPDG